MEAAASEQRELDRQESYYRNGRRAAPLAHRTIVVVTDGLTKESNLLAAIEALRRHAAAKVVGGDPGRRPPLATAMRKVDELIADRELDATTSLEAWFGDTDAVGDETVRLTLQHAAKRHS